MHDALSAYTAVMTDDSGFPKRPALGLLLAAGFGRRYAHAAAGADKLMQTLDDGLRVAQRAARQLRLAVPATLAVLRPEQQELAELLQAEGCTVLHAPQAQAGMGASLAAGMQALHSGPGTADAVVVALGDMPWLQASTICFLLNHAAANRIVAPHIAGQRGHPVIFGRDFWPALCALDGDQGARALLQEHGYMAIEVDDPGIVRDIDLPKDLNQDSGLRPRS